MEVEEDEMGHFVDTKTGDIWDLDAQKIVGQKDLNTGKCSCHPEHKNVSEASMAKLVTQLQTETKAIVEFAAEAAEAPLETLKTVEVAEAQLETVKVAEAAEAAEAQVETVATEPVKKRSRAKK